MTIREPARLLSLWQPWAEAMCCGEKRVETRSWSTSYRGIVAIHAAKTMNGEIRRVALRKVWVDRVLGSRMIDDLPFGVIVAVGRLVACIPTEVVDVPERELAFGDYSRDRYAWMFGGVTPLKNPLPYRGSQGLRELNEAASGFLRRALRRNTS